MAHQIVHRLKAIKIDKHHRRVGLIIHLRQHAPNLVVDPGTIMQPGQRIQRCQLLQIAHPLFVSRNVARHQNCTDIFGGRGIDDATGFGAQNDVVAVTMQLAHLNDVRQHSPVEDAGECFRGGAAVIGMQEIHHQLTDNFFGCPANHFAIRGRD